MVPAADRITLRNAHQQRERSTYGKKISGTPPDPKLVRGWLGGARLFCLENGYVGVAVGVEEGDEVILAARARCPVMIRPTGEFYIFVSVSRLLGTMTGEVWHDKGLPDALWGEPKKNPPITMELLKKSVLI
jgi:hypothetical protein